MSAETKRFHIGDILSITDGRLLSLDGMSGVQGLLTWMADDAVFTHQLPRVMDEAEPYLREWFPDLAAVVVPDPMPRGWNNGSIEAWLATLGEQWRDVPRLPGKDHARIDPVLELSHMIGHDRVVPVVLP